MDPATIALILNTAGGIFGFFGKKKEEREDAGDLALTIGDDIAAYNQEILNIDTQIETAQLNQQMYADMADAEMQAAESRVLAAETELNTALSGQRAKQGASGYFVTGAGGAQKSAFRMDEAATMESARAQADIYGQQAAMLGIQIEGLLTQQEYYQSTITGLEGRQDTATWESMTFGERRDAINRGEVSGAIGTANMVDALFGGDFEGLSFV